MIMLLLVYFCTMPCNLGIKCQYQHQAVHSLSLLGWNLWKNGDPCMVPVVSVTISDTILLDSWLWKKKMSLITLMSTGSTSMSIYYSPSMIKTVCEGWGGGQILLKGETTIIIQKGSPKLASFLGHLMELLDRYHTGMGFGSIGIDSSYVGVNVIPIPFIFVNYGQVIKVMVEGIANGASLHGMLCILIGISGQK